MKSYKIGDIVTYLREVPDEDWKNIGKVPFNFKIGDKVEINDISQHHPNKEIKSLKIGAWWYPSTMFESLNENFYAI